MKKDELGKYTYWPDRKSFYQEWQMVQNVVDAKEDIETLQIYLAPLVTFVVKNFTELHPGKPLPDKLFNAAFMYLPIAIKRYIIRKEDGHTGFKFSSYYEWFIRQGFLDYHNNRLEN